MMEGNILFPSCCRLLSGSSIISPLHIIVIFFSFMV
jgi:hypothetical protein